MWQVHPVALTSLIRKLKEPMNFTEPKGTVYFRCKISGQLTGSSQYHQKKNFEFIVITQRRQRVMKRGGGGGGEPGAHLPLSHTHTPTRNALNCLLAQANLFAIFTVLMSVIHL